MIKQEIIAAFFTKDGFCDDEESFLSLLKANKNIKITRNIFRFKNKEFNYNVLFGEVRENIKYYHLTVITDSTDNLELMSELQRQIKIILGKHCESNSIQILWDGIGFEYCKLAYPIIYKLENKLRYLITKFMLVNVGLGWDKENIPQELKNNIKIKSSDILRNLDFVHLADFLFKPYSYLKNDELRKFLKQHENEKVDKADVMKYLPKSNWEKYFSDIVECEEGHLDKQWNKIYEIRCD